MAPVHLRALLFTTAFTLIALAYSNIPICRTGDLSYVSIPATAVVDISGLAFHIGDNYLLLRGEHQLSAEAPGYFPLNKTIQVTDQATQEIDVELQPLPGNLSGQCQPQRYRGIY